MVSLHFKKLPVYGLLVFTLLMGFGAIWQTSQAQGQHITAVWANNGGDKVTQDELRASNNLAGVYNSVWDGETVRVFGARNEVVAFNLILEAPLDLATGVTVSFDELGKADSAAIRSVPTTGDGVFDWTNRNIELFLVRYLEIKGLSLISYETYDERHIPERMRRTWSDDGEGSGAWENRPDHNKFYPDIAVPMELASSFDIAAGHNQSIWVDIYIPASALAGVYQGTVTVSENGATDHQIPVELTVRNFTLPDTPTAKTMLYIGYEDINLRYLGEEYPDAEHVVRLLRDRHFMIAHRHRLSLIDANDGLEDWSLDQPRPDWIPRLDGSLFTAAHGYDGPGVGVGNGIFSIGTYGSWEWQGDGEAAMHQHSDAWATWFEANAPNTEYFLYLIDESDDFGATEQWANWITNNPGPGSRLPSFATIGLPDAAANIPSLNIAAAWSSIGLTAEWQSAADIFRNDPDKRLFMYNGLRPCSGSFATEDDGVALRELVWGQYKLGIDRWFFWEGTYYNNYQGNTGQINVFQSAQTFGDNDYFDEELGESGWNYSNGDGVLFYPGTDTVYPAESYGVLGPFASLRLKHWRRGIQDAEYLAMAMAIDPARTQQIINEIIPSVLWEVGVEDPDEPTWVLTDISWPTDPDVWEEARAELADIIEPG